MSYDFNGLGLLIEIFAAARNEGTECSDWEHYCDDKCLPNSYKCDGLADCYDRSDEENCLEIA